MSSEWKFAVVLLAVIVTLLVWCAHSDVNALRDLQRRVGQLESQQVKR